MEKDKIEKVRLYNEAAEVFDSYVPLARDIFWAEMIGSSIVKRMPNDDLFQFTSVLERMSEIREVFSASKKDRMVIRQAAIALRRELDKRINNQKIMVN